jgi:nicotinamidase-related amidase
VDAIIVVDLQRAFPVPADLEERIRVRAGRFPRRVFTRFVNPAGSLFRRKLDRRSCSPRDDDCELVIEPLSGDLVFDKPGYGLTPTHIKKLRAADIRHALVCGIDTDACVLGVMFSLFDAGIECSVDPSLCWSSAGLHHEALLIMEHQFGTPGDLLRTTIGQIQADEARGRQAVGPER